MLDHAVIVAGSQALSASRLEILLLAKRKSGLETAVSGVH